MPSSVGHAFAALTIGSVFASPPVIRRYWISGVLCSVILDVDAIGRPFGMGDVVFLGGHRALIHSLAFALALGVGVAWLGFRSMRWDEGRGRVALYLVLATASHGILDAFASYGDGVAFFSPFSATRYSASWRPFKGLNEVWLLWLPAAILTSLVWYARRAWARPAGPEAQ